MLATVVDHCTDATPRCPGDNRVTDLQFTLIDENRGNRATALIEVCLEHDALGSTGGVRSQFFKFSDDEQLIEKVVDANILQRRHLNHNRVAAPRLGDEFVFSELCQHSLRICVLFVDLVHRHNDRNLCGTSVTDGLNGLRHHAVISGHDEHNNVGGLRSAGTHIRKCSVTRSIDERNDVTTSVDLVGADVLGDATRLSVNNICRTDLVKNRGLTVVNMAHHRDDWRPQLLSLLVVIVTVIEECLQFELLLLARVDEKKFGANIEGEQFHVII